MSATKWETLAEDTPAGTLNVGVISLSNTLITSLALLVLVGKASGHPEKVSVRIKRYRYRPFLGSSEKSICLCCPG